MKKVILGACTLACVLFFYPMFEAVSDEQAAKVQCGDDDRGVSVSGSVSDQARGNETGATVEHSATGMTIHGISSSVVHVDTRTVQGSADGTLRINWGGGDRSRGSGSGSPVTPPGAPELPANWMFGTGFMVFGFGLLLYRRRLT